MRVLFLINPVAGGRDRTEQIRAMAEAAFAGRPDSYEFYITQAPLDARDEVRRRAESGEELWILSCGGDGTFNECVSGAAGAKNLAVAPFPIGTGNDFCRMFGEERALYSDLNALLDGSLRPMDLIAVNGRWCDGICSAGVDARIGTGVHRYTHLPFCKGKLAYVVSLIVELCRGISQPMRIELPGYTRNGPVSLCCVCNGQYYGGGFHPSPDARPDDGILDVYIIGRVSLPQLIRGFPRYISARAEEVPDIVTHRRTDRLTISSDTPLVINLDGEVLNTTRAEIRLVPQCVNLIVPKGLTFFS